MIEITGVLSAVSQLVGIAKVAVEARDDAKAKAALSDVTAKLTDLTMSALVSAEKAANLHAALAEAQAELRALKAKQQERDKYALTEIRPGAYAYASAPQSESAHSEPLHYLCQACFDAGTKAVLRHRAAKTGADAYYDCPIESRHNINMGGAKPFPPPARVVSDW